MHQGYNDIAGSCGNEKAQQYKYNGKELEQSFGLNSYEMDLRQYDPATGRWVVQDPIVHHEYSPYSAFDNNPVYWSDPSGADATAYMLNGNLVGATFTGQDAIDAFFHLTDGSPEKIFEAALTKFYEFEDFDENNGNGGGGGDPKKKKASKKTSKKTSTIGGAGLVLTAEIVEAAGVLGSLSWVSVFGTALLLNGDSSPDRFAEFAQYGGVAGSWPWQHAASRDIVENINSRKNNSGYYMHYTSMKSALMLYGKVKLSNQD